MSALSLLFVPFVAVLIDLLTQMRARITKVNYFPITENTLPSTDYTIIVPIYRNFRYLENIDYLDQYGDRVLLTTSKSETPEFYAELRTVALEHGFRVHVSSRLPSPRERAADHLKARATGGMAGWFEVRADGPKPGGGKGRHHYRLYCLLDYDAHGVARPLLVVISGASKAFRTRIPPGDYARIRALGREYLARNPRSLA